MKTAFVTTVVVLAGAAGASAGISGFTFNGGMLGSNRLADVRLRVDNSVIDATPGVLTLDSDENFNDMDASATLNASASTAAAVSPGTVTGAASQMSSILLGGIGSSATVSGRADASTPATSFPEEALSTVTSFFSVDLFLGAGDYDISAMWNTSIGSNGRGSFSLRAVGGTIDDGFLFTAGDAFGGLDVGSSMTTLTLAGDATKYVMTFDLDAGAGGVASAASTRFAEASFTLTRVPGPGACAVFAAGALAAGVRRRR